MFVCALQNGQRLTIGRKNRSLYGRLTRVVLLKPKREQQRAQGSGEGRRKKSLQECPGAVQLQFFLLCNSRRTQNKLDWPVYSQRPFHFAPFFLHKSQLGILGSGSLGYTLAKATVARTFFGKGGENTHAWNYSSRFNKIWLSSNATHIIDRFCKVVLWSPSCIEFVRWPAGPSQVEGYVKMQEMFILLHTASRGRYSYCLPWHGVVKGGSKFLFLQFAMKIIVNISRQGYGLCLY